jgi:hypothetical protein
VNLDIRRVSELCADRNRNVRRVEPGSRNLVQERLKQMMVPLIDQENVDTGRIRQPLRRVQTTEAAAHDHDSLVAGCACRMLKSHAWGVQLRHSSFAIYLTHSDLVAGS